MNYKAYARRVARRYGLDPGIFVRQIQAESGFNPRARSPAGALGIAQIMPGTARSWGVDPLNPKAALDAAARNMAKYVKQLGSYEKALRAYNAGPGAVEKSYSYPETNAYVKKILGQGGEPSERPRRGPGTTVLKTTRTPAQTDVKQAIIDTFLEGGKNPLLRAAGRVQSGAYTTPAKTTRERVRVPGGVSEGSETPRGGNFKVAPSANRKGVGLSKPLTGFLSEVASIGGSFTVTTGSQHSKMTINGNVSDHWDGNGADIAISGSKGDRLAEAALRAAGVPRAKARRMARNGGLYNVRYQGRRVQIIWKTHEGGNHYNHLHIGIR